MLRALSRIGLFDIMLASHNYDGFLAIDNLWHAPALTTGRPSSLSNYQDRPYFITHTLFPDQTQPL
ncbi:hypothetical protein EDC27_1872 [Desulfosoma caldarium]|uniref:Uncharacterized protein n=1 Tax=Desulfosoma caldarium TaxID=610254 RepID=A0A3N1UQ39_9BACT|nr:hypothetical protein EDC27_1872 [Desulfosoma caldarium]